MPKFYFDYFVWFILWFDNFRKIKFSILSVQIFIIIIFCDLKKKIKNRT